jgi:hypothetical protein
MLKENRSVLSGMSRTWRAGTLLMVAGVATSACGSAQLFAPTSSTIIESYAWDFKDGTTAGATYAVTVTATTADDRTAVGRTEILVKFP